MVPARSPHPSAALLVMTLFVMATATAAGASCGSNGSPSPSASASASASAPPVRRPRPAGAGPSNTSAPSGPREPCGEYDTEGCQALCVKGIGRACHNAAASLVAQGDEQEKRAVELFEEGCRLGDVESCRKGAMRLGTTPDMHRDAFQRARALLDKGCEIGSAPACKDAYRALIGIDKERAKKASARLCALDPSAPACAAADDALLDRAEKARASCEKGEPAGCALLGHALRGLDEPRRIDAYKRACLQKGLGQPAPMSRECIQWLREVGEREAKSEAAPPPAPAKKPGKAKKLSVRVGAITTWDGAAPPPDPSVEDASVGDGAPPHTAIRKAVKAIEPALLACYKTGVAADPSLEGRVTTRFFIDRQGEAAIPQSAGSDLPDAALVACVLRAFEKVRAEPSEKGIGAARVPVVFTMSE